MAPPPDPPVFPLKGPLPPGVPAFFEPPPPPPVEVIVDEPAKIEFEPFVPGLQLDGAPEPPPPTVTGYGDAATGKAVTQAPKGDHE